jgi:hypothetical protein
MNEVAMNALLLDWPPPQVPITAHTQERLTR